jgi:hypothetical protein
MVGSMGLVVLGGWLLEEMDECAKSGSVMEPPFARVMG